MKNVLTGLILMLGLIIQAQDYSKNKVKWSAIIKSKGTPYSYMEVDEGYLVTSSKTSGLVIGAPSKLFIDFVDKKFMQKSRFELTQYLKDKDETFEKLEIVGKSVILFSKKTDKAKQSMKLLARVYDIEKNRPNNQVIEIAKLDVSNIKKSKKTMFEVVSSRDKNSHALIIHYPYSKNEKDRIGVYTYSSNLSLLWKKELYEFDYLDKKYAIIDYALNNSGDLAIVGRLSISKKEAKEKNEKAHKEIEVVSFSENGETVTNFPINLQEDTYVNSMLIGFGDAGYLNAAGFYSKDPYGNGDGAYIASIDIDSQEITEIKKEEFSDDFLKEGMRLKAQKKADKQSQKKGKDLEMPNLEIREIIFCEDGSYRLIGEQYYSYTVTTTNANGGTTSTTYYVYNDIVVVKIDANKEFEWIRKINKRQRFANTSLYESYDVIVGDGNLYFYYNDNIENHMEIDPTKGYQNMSFKKKKGVVTEEILNEDGEKTKKILYDLLDEKKYFAPAYSGSIDGKMIMFGNVRGKGYHLGNLEIR